MNPSGNDCPFALQNIVCVLLLEITKFLRETYQYMPKKVTYSLKNEHHMVTYGKSGSGEHQIIPDTNRTHVGSVFSNESASVYSAQATFNPGGGNSKHKASIDNLSSGGNNPADLHEAVHSDTSKHISFVVSGDVGEKSSNYHSLQEINDEMSLPVPAHSNKPAGAFNRRSVRGTTKRSSLKLRMGHRASTFEKHNRKASHTTNQSHYTSDEREEDSFGNNAPQSGGEVESLNMANEEPKSAVPRDNSFTNPDAFGLNDTCEVDEVEFNRCFPWIKVSFTLSALFKRIFPLEKAVLQFEGGNKTSLFVELHVRTLPKRKRVNFGIDGKQQMLGHLLHEVVQKHAHTGRSGASNV